MISRIFIATGATIAASSDTGSMETIKNVLLIAFLVVAVIWLLIDARRNLTATYGGAPVESTPAQPRATATVPAAVASSAGQPSPEVLAVIAAAVHATLGGSSRIIAISADDDETQSWAAEGRRAIYATRKVR